MGRPGAAVDSAAPPGRQRDAVDRAAQALCPPCEPISPEAQEAADVPRERFCQVVWQAHDEPRALEYLVLVRPQRQAQRVLTRTRTRVSWRLRWRPRPPDSGRVTFYFFLPFSFYLILLHRI